MDRKETVHPGPALLSTSWVQLTWGVNACMAGDQAGDGPSKEAASPAVYRLLISISHLKRTELPRGMVTDLLPPPPYLHWLYFPSKHTSTSSKHSLQNEATYKLPAALILALTSDKAAPKACDTSFLVCSTGVLFSGWASLANAYSNSEQGRQLLLFQAPSCCKADTAMSSEGLQPACSCSHGNNAAFHTGGKQHATGVNNPFL